MFATVAFMCAMRQDFHQLAKLIEPTRKPRVLVVGFYHFANPKLDAVKADLDDHLSEKRQKEILELIERLAEFKPTKIAVEKPRGDLQVNVDYAAWREGRRPLAVSETEQVGFRLADKLGQSSLFPIDFKLDLDFDPTLQWANSHDSKKAEMVQTMFGAITKVMESLCDHTVIDNIRMLNDPEADRIGNGFYLRLATIARDDEHPGADLAADWWKRNIVWLSNIAQIAVDQNDHVLVICGGGHASLLRSLLRDSIDMESVPVGKYLRT